MSDTPPAPPSKEGGLLPTGKWKLPVVGEVKKAYVIGAAAVLFVGGVLWWRKTHPSAPAGGLATDSAGNVGVINPATGFVAGSPEDLAAINAAAATGADGSGSGGGGGATSGSLGPSIGDQVAAGPPFTNNAAWSQYATTYLTGTLNLDPGAVGTDLGAYLAGDKVNQAQRVVILDATTYAGPPPVAGPNGYPPSINVSGDVSGVGSAPGPVTLTTGNITVTTARVNWTAVSGATGYAYTVTGAGVNKHGTVTVPTLGITGLKGGEPYHVTVHAVNASGAGPESSLDIHTPASSSSKPAGNAAYATVVVAEFVKAHPAWDSTVSGIAEHYGYGADWETVWNDPKNANLRALRKAPDAIRKGDVIYVREK